MGHRPNADMEKTLRELMLGILPDDIESALSDGSEEPDISRHGSPLSPGTGRLVDQPPIISTYDKFWGIINHEEWGGKPPDNPDSTPLTSNSLTATDIKNLLATGQYTLRELMEQNSQDSGQRLFFDGYPDSSAEVEPGSQPEFDSPAYWAQFESRESNQDEN